MRLPRRPLGESYPIVAAAPYDFALWDPPPEPTGAAPIPAGYPSPASWLRFARNRRMEELGTVVTLGVASRFPLLHSGAATPFTYGGLACASLAAFYQALHIVDEDERRAYAANPFRRKLRAAASFDYQRRTIAVWSVEHDTLIAGAVEAKVEQNPAVRRELTATGRRPIFIGSRFMDTRFDEPRGGLWKAMPLALMILRAK